MHGSWNRGFLGTLSYSIAVNMVTSQLVCLGRKIGTENCKLVKSLGEGIKLGGGRLFSRPGLERVRRFYSFLGCFRKSSTKFLQIL